MVYADYEYYTNQYYGTLPEDSFNSLIVKASREIDNNVNTDLTQEIINNLNEKAQDKLKYTACALVDLINTKETNNSQRLSSISIDGVNKSFKTISNNEIRMERKKILSYLPDELTKYL